MCEEKKKSETDEVPDEELNDVSGGVVSPVTKKTEITDIVDGESTDKDHKAWTDI